MSKQDNTKKFMVIFNQSLTEVSESPKPVQTAFERTQRTWTEIHGRPLFSNYNYFRVAKHRFIRRSRPF